MSGIENELLFNCSFFLPISVFFTRCLKDSNAFFPWRKAFHLNTENEKKTHSAYSLAFQKRFDSFLIKEFIMKKGLCFVLLMLGTANAIERKRQPSEEENLRKRTIDSAFFAEIIEEEDSFAFRDLEGGSMSMRVRNLMFMSMSMSM